MGEEGGGFSCPAQQQSKKKKNQGDYFGFQCSVTIQSAQFSIWNVL